ncbi:MAG: PKD domain-containing protein [Planctomycetota bacterium]
MTKQDDQTPKKNDKPTLGGETVEPRILLSATWITGTDGDETVTGTDGHDNLAGLGGNDVLVGADGNDVLDGGDGIDIVDYSSAGGTVLVDLGAGTVTGSAGRDTLQNIEGVTGSDNADTIVGSGGDDLIDAGGGDDMVYASAGDDRLDGGAGTDTLSYVGFDGGVTVDLTDGNPQDTGAAGTDTILGFERVEGSAGDDTFVFSNPQAGAEYTVAGNRGTDTIDLSNYASTDAVISGKTITVSIDKDTSFVINYTGIASIQFSDMAAAAVADSDTGSAPVADAGANQVVSEGTEVTLDGGASFDADGDELKYYWTQVSGPSVTLNDATTSAPTFAAPEGLVNSSLEFELTVSDGENFTTDRVVVTVNADDDAPTADAGTDQIVDEGDVVTLTGLGSTDPEGQSLTYTWTQVSGPTVTLDDANAAQPTFTAPEGISNTSVGFELTVSDGTNVSSVDTVTVTVNADNDAPSSHAGADQSVDEGDVVTLNGLGSSDPEGQGLTYTWVQTGGPTVTLSDANAAQPTFTAPETTSSSSLTFELTVSDGTNVSSVDTVEITVGGDDDAPTADAGSNATVEEGDVVVLRGSGTDPEGQGLTYSWRQVQGPTVQLEDADSATTRFRAPESMRNTIVQFELTVSDGVNSSTDLVTFGIQADDDAPRIDAGDDQVVRRNQDVQLRARASDPENGTLSYQWRQIGGPSVDLQDGDSGAPTFTAPDLPEGTVLTFVAGVDDGTNQAFDTVTVVVAPNVGPQVTIDGVPDLASGAPGVIQANAADPDGDPLRFRWTQVGGPTARMPANDQPQLRFQAPEVDVDTTLTFQVEVFDGDRATIQVVNVQVQAATASAATPAPQPAPTTTDDASGGDTVDAATSERDEAADRIREAIQSSASNRLDDMLATAAGNSLDLDDRSDDDGSPGLLASVTLDADAGATSDDAGDNTAAGDEELRSSNLTGDASEAGLDSYYANLLEEPAAAATAAGTRIELPDLVLVEAGDAIELTARAAAEATAAELADARWTQVSGTPVDLDASGADGMLRIRTPELFVEEELVFEVEVWSGGERVVQEVTVQVEPVGMTSRSLSIDEHVESQQERANTDEEQGARGVGRIWGALLAFFGAQTGRRKRDS